MVRLTIMLPATWFSLALFTGGGGFLLVYACNHQQAPENNEQ